MSNTYRSSGKINPSKTILAFLAAVPLAIIFGTLYGVLANWIPYIIIDVIVFGLAVAGLGWLVQMIVKYGTIRNRPLKLLFGIIISFLGWYSSWVYVVSDNNYLNLLFDISETAERTRYYLNNSGFSIGKSYSESAADISGIGMWIIAGIELLLLMIAPTFFSFILSKDYFCESCNKFNTEKEFYLHSVADETKLISFAQSGNYTGLAAYKKWITIPSAIGEADITQPVYKTEVSYCTSCGGNGIINIEKGKFNINKENKLEFKEETNIAKDILISDTSVKAIVGA